MIIAINTTVTYSHKYLIDMEGTATVLGYDIDAYGEAGYYLYDSEGGFMFVSNRDMAITAVTSPLEQAWEQGCESEVEREEREATVAGAMALDDGTDGCGYPWIWAMADDEWHAVTTTRDYPEWDALVASWGWPGI